MYHALKFPDTQGEGRYKRATDAKTACPVIAIADYKFYQIIGGSNNFTTANYIVSFLCLLLINKLSVPSIKGFIT